MGIFSRSNSSASSRRTSRLLQGPNPTFSSSPQTHLHPSDHQGSQNGNPTELSHTARPCIRYGSPVDQSIEPSSSTSEMIGNPDLVAPSIPLRTSSKDAAIGNSLARSLVSRARKLKSSASKLSLVSNISTSTLRSTASRDVDNNKNACIYPKKSNAQVDVGSSSISSPSHFRHLTHALPQQFSKIASATQSDLVADFSVMRASQNTRRDFRGIKTVDLHSRTSSVETNSASLASSETNSSLSSATLSCTSESTRNSVQNFDHSLPLRSHEIYRKMEQETYYPPARASVVLPLSPPPRKSSRRASTQYEHAISTDESRQRSSSGPISHACNAIRSGSECLSRPQYELLETTPEPTFSNNLQRLRLSNEASYEAGDWGLTSHGRTLPCVDEEEAIIRPLSRPTSVASISRNSKQCHGVSAQPEPSSSGSSSQNSTSTVTSCRYTPPLGNKGNGIGSATSTTMPNAEHRRSMQRSSLNNGLFTSWSFEEEPLYNRPIPTAIVEQSPTCSRPGPIVQSARPTPGTKVVRNSRIPVRSAVSWRQAHSNHLNASP